ncbi:MAG: hypothetical protein LAP87_29380 [Acidobacteriia bacterium]|nr:hypothetical protein [Terriglobia bacterium]
MDAKPVALSPSELLIDLENPRIPGEVSGQREALRALAEQQKQKLLTLAQHIVAYGSLNPAELPIVMQSSGSYIVLEGNRRLTALRALETPDLFVGALPPGILDGIRSLSPKYRSAPIGEVYCITARSREEAQPWIDIRHNGENFGAGVVPWGSDEKAKNAARLGRPVKLHTRLLDFMQQGGHLSQADRERIKTTNFERVLKSQVLKDALGIDAERGGRFTIVGEEAHTVRALRALFKRLTAASVKTFYSRAERDDWVEEFLATLPVVHATPQASGAPAEARTAAARAAEPTRSRVVHPRAKLIDPKCLLRVKDARVRRIENELRELLLEDFPNAISVLFRVFIELSVDWYIAQNPSAAPPVKPVKPNPNNPNKPNKPRDPSLSQKMQSVKDYLVAGGKLTKQGAQPVKRACENDSFLGPSVILLNEYVHTYQMNPSPTDLRAQWDSLEPFIIAVWPR